MLEEVEKQKEDSKKNNCDIEWTNVLKSYIPGIQTSFLAQGSNKLWMFELNNNEHFCFCF